MKRWRIWLVGILAVVIIVGHAWDICASVEHWPFSYYPMYGRLQAKPKLTLLSLIIRTPKALIRITDQNYVPQLGETRLRNILMKAWYDVPEKRHDIAVRNVQNILRDYRKLYESRRIAGLHSGPLIVELQFCRMTWKLHEDGKTSKPLIEPLIGLRADGTFKQYQSTQPTSKPEDGVD